MRESRARKLKRRLPKISSEERAYVRALLSTWRKRQRKMKPDYVPDPHPYEYTYVFYCLEAGAAVNK